ncbi:hypothetical protein IVA96_07065 [Bradyrhizobium sp. 159]|uniref:hypothetical protein n=1 Tax=Bradyrhizobium sp. 159 TaxID=2782632 RepID=UPI001FF984EC|nr:hypothetical protein [Bradyrhizobium sp. 159]MCK1616420.1 hypothetical protein [Bradyrhizobium sp. 159]
MKLISCLLHWTVGEDRKPFHVPGPVTKTAPDLVRSAKSSGWSHDSGLDLRQEPLQLLALVRVNLVLEMRQQPLFLGNQIRDGRHLRLLLGQSTLCGMVSTITQIFGLNDPRTGAENCGPRVVPAVKFSDVGCNRNDRAIELERRWRA